MIAGTVKGIDNEISTASLQRIKFKNTLLLYNKLDSQNWLLS